MKELFICIALAVTTACSEAPIISPELPAGCESPRACQVSGVDLVVDAPVLLLSANQRKDDITGLPVLLPAQGFRAIVRVWNRGDRTSVPRELDVEEETSRYTVTLPALAPGGVFTDTFDMKARTSMGWSDSSRVYVYLHEWSEDGLFTSNDDATTPFIVTVPVIRSTLTFPDTIRLGVPFTGTIRYDNISRYADIGPQTMTLCMAGSFTVPCGGEGIGPLQLIPIPGIKAGESSTTTVTFNTPTTQLCVFCGNLLSMWIVSCIGPPNSAWTDFVWPSSKTTCIYEKQRPVIINTAPLAGVR